MNIFKLAFHSLKYYWKAALAISAGTAVAIAALTGSFLVGKSVKNNLRDIAVTRLSNVEAVVQSDGFFTKELAYALRKNPGSENITQPALILFAAVTEPINGIIVPDVNLLGMEGGGFKYGIGSEVIPPEGREVYLSEILLRELKVKTGDFLVIKTRKAGAAAPVETLFGQKELFDNIQSFSVKVIGAIPDKKAGSFNLKSETANPRNIYISLDFLQKELKKKELINTVFLLKSGSLSYWEERLKEVLSLADLGLKLNIKKKRITLESGNFTLSPGVIKAAVQAADRLKSECALTSVYIFNNVNGASPYSVVGGLEGLGKDEIILSDWMAEDTGSEKGSTLKAEYFELAPDGQYITKSKIFKVKDILKTEALAELVEAPFLEGMTDSKSISAWKSPFPVDMSRIRNKDEIYWNNYKTVPKALISLETAKSFWPPQYFGVTSIRISDAKKIDIQVFKKVFLKHYDYSDSGFRVLHLREEALKAAQGSTDYSLLFAALSFIIVLSALWLTAFLFRIFLEARGPQAGILLASGFKLNTLFAVYMLEGGLIILLGCLISLPLSVYYAGFVLGFLKPLLGESSSFKLYLERADILTGLISGSLLSLLSILWGVLMFKKVNIRALLAKKVFAPGKIAPGPKVKGFISLALRSVFYSGKRSYFTAVLFAAAAFIIIMTALNRPESFIFNTLDKNSGSGGYNLIAKSSVPVFGSLNTPQGRKKNSFVSFDSPVWKDVVFTGCRQSREGDNISCLNINQPGQPRVLGIPEEIINERGFAFSSYEKLKPGETPWAGLKAQYKNGALPVYADANSLEWILHKKIGEEILLNGKYSVKVSGALSGSIFADVLLISEENFIKIYGSNGGYNYFLIRTKEGREEEVLTALRRELGGAGYTVAKTSELLSAFANVQNIYLFTFQILGGLGFLLGTFGIIAVLLQNVYERRQEFALQSALGFKKSLLVRQVMLENGLLLVIGLFIGFLASFAVSLPYIMKMHKRLDFTLPVITLLGMLLLGLSSCAVAAYYSLKGNLIEALKSE
ncbi:MAG: ABC transporter permease [Candidatus Firestonebacteria bacterium]